MGKRSTAILRTITLCLALASGSAFAQETYCNSTEGAQPTTPVSGCNQLFNGSSSTVTGGNTYGGNNSVTGGNVTGGNNTATNTASGGAGGNASTTGSGNSTGGNQSTTVNANSYQVRQVASANAPISLPTATCVVAGSAGLQLPVLGISIGGGHIDKSCQRQERIRVVADVLHDVDTAEQMECDEPDYAEARRKLGRPCK